MTRVARLGGCAEAIQFVLMRIALAMTAAARGVLNFEMDWSPSLILLMASGAHDAQMGAR